ncbi:restriction endonuclease subunit S [Streptomyces sp. NBC_00038]|uniref:restriction endonuclease subunit S n=1 Tax=Streptomyces sp. NBC_00038 TaxID=2903615 RepID=UPI00224DF1F3|nr:restriction endonuclease subunit S [Streptomyces sp. NBC_00038]MCX5558384.1 restriction endonuclease subunit S [Streptomyces sp. NBC_00038]
MWSLTTVEREIVEPTDLGDEVVHYSIPSVDSTGTGQIEESDSIKSAKFRLSGGEVLISKLNPRKSRVVSVAASSLPIVSSTEFVGLRAGDALDSRYLAYLLQSDFVRQDLDARVQSVTRSHQRVAPEDITHLNVTVAPSAEQRHIADFLDAETGRIDRLVRAREAQIGLLGQRLAQLVDGIVAGELEVLDSIGARFDSDNWGHGKISRFCEVIPGYAFPSSAFVTDGSGIRLLRGINVGVGDLVWEDVVSWDAATYPVPERFHLRAGDLVLGMDRPWISSGMRINLIDESNVPALLLQRVACLRPKSPNINIRFIHWVLRSTQFRLGVESEMTGVSVPHLSGEQIGTFSFSLPTLDEQTRLAASLEHHASSTRRLQATMTRQVSLLVERRQALITAAVTGQFDVATVSGRNATDGVSA